MIGLQTGWVALTLLAAAVFILAAAVLAGVAWLVHFFMNGGQGDE